MEIGDIFVYIYIYIWYVRPHFSSVVQWLCNVGGVKCQPFLKQSNHWKGALKMIFKGSGCFQFAEAVVTFTVKKAVPQPYILHYKFSLFYRNRKCRVESVVYNCKKLL